MLKCLSLLTQMAAIFASTEGDTPVFPRTLAPGEDLPDPPPAGDSDSGALIPDNSYDVVNGKQRRGKFVKNPTKRATTAVEWRRGQAIQGRIGTSLKFVPMRRHWQDATNSQALCFNSKFAFLPPLLSWGRKEASTAINQVAAKLGILLALRWSDSSQWITRWVS